MLKSVGRDCSTGETVAGGAKYSQIKYAMVSALATPKINREILVLFFEAILQVVQIIGSEFDVDRTG